MARIIVKNLSLQFRIYHENGTSLKEYFANTFHKHRLPPMSEFLALDDLSFSVQDGQRVGVIGRNGAGKSTLLKTICKIYEPTTGSIEVCGRIAPLLEIGAGFNPEFTGRENIYFYGAILGYNKNQLKEIEQEVIDFAELAEFIDVPVKYYSTGMYMRLAFSLATTVKPDILVLDELFVGGDASFVKRGKARMNSMIDQSNLMILVSHDTTLLRSLCSRFIWLEHGRIMLDGDASVVERYMSS